MAKNDFSNELDYLRKYIQSPSRENAKTLLLYPIFQKIFKDSFVIQTDADLADGYVEGQIIIETKSNFKDWVEGFFQALHYEQKYGLSFHTIIVMAKEFIGIWRVNKLPINIKEIAYTTNRDIPPNKAGKINAKKINTAGKLSIISASELFVTPDDFVTNIYREGRSYIHLTHEIKDILVGINIGDEFKRSQINIGNFISAIEQMKRFFSKPIDAVHAFYTMVAFWDISSTLITNETGDISLLGFQQTKNSKKIEIHEKNYPEFKRFVETKYVKVNGGSGIRTDDYFARFDEVIAVIDPEYVRQHGIFFTDNNLSKFALWFAKEYLDENINEDYIVFDPAGGSGNLVSSWKGHLKHKIVSELQPDLLKTIEKRLEADPYHTNTGFTIIPKTSTGEGLNFLDTDAKDYLEKLYFELALNHQSIDKPFAFLLNPPYKNTDENVKMREQTESHYEIHPSITDITGEGTGGDRYAAFLGQILNISILQNFENKNLRPIVMIFTPTSWLIPRSNYTSFRQHWDRCFKYHSGFIITSNEWFKVDGKWPLAFTIWGYNEDPDNNNKIRLLDLTNLKKSDFTINWNEDEKELRKLVNQILRKKESVLMDNSRGSIKDSIGQKQYAFKRDPTKTELNSNKLFGGLPLKDKRRFNKKTYGIADSQYIGFMDDNTPVRVVNDSYNRTTTIPDRVWLQLRPTFIDINLTKIQSCPQDKYGYCAYDLPSAKITFTWFAITKALNGKYPLWVNQYDIWQPIISPEFERYWYSLCFAFALAENRCVVTKFEKDNPVMGAEEIFINNPLCPTLNNSFWNNILNKEIVTEPSAAIDLVNEVKILYNIWNSKYTKGQSITAYELQDEAYFKYFDYPPFLTAHSGLIQIRKYAEQGLALDLLDQFKVIAAHSKNVKQELYRLLVDEFKYFM